MRRRYATRDGDAYDTHSYGVHFVWMPSGTGNAKEKPRKTRGRFAVPL